MTLVIPCQSRAKLSRWELCHLLKSDLLSSLSWDKAALSSISRKELPYLRKLTVLICKTAACNVDGEETCSVWQTQLSVSNSLLQYYKDADVLRLCCGNSWIGTALSRVASRFVICWRWNERVSLTLYGKRNLSVNKSFFSMLADQNFCSEMLLTWQLSINS